MSANGMICIGTTKGWTLVFDFAQTLKCVCGNESIGECIQQLSRVTKAFIYIYI